MKSINTKREEFLYSKREASKKLNNTIYQLFNREFSEINRIVNVLAIGKEHVEEENLAEHEILNLLHEKKRFIIALEKVFSTKREKLQEEVIELNKMVMSSSFGVFLVENKSELVDLFTVKKEMLDETPFSILLMKKEMALTVIKNISMPYDNIIQDIMKMF